MVSADNLNLDCLEIIFAYLAGNDLVSVSLVSKSFLAAVIPHLYRTLFFHVGNAKKYPRVPTPFDIVVMHPNLAVHVRAIDIRTVPLSKGVHHPAFLQNCRRAIELAKNLRSFTCTPTGILPSFLLVLKGSQNIERIRFNATLTVEQAKLVTSLKKLRTLSMDACSWNVVDVLPSWTKTLQSSLTSLTLNAVIELHGQFLQKILSHVPHLTSLHVMGCTKVEHTDVLKAAFHTPLLECLSLTAWDARALPAGLPTLPHLRYLTLDTHATLPVNPQHATTPPLWKSIVSTTRSWACPLESISFRLSDRWSVPDIFIHDLMYAHRLTLKQLALLDCDISVEGVREIAAKCASLQKLAIYVPKKELVTFTDALSRSQSIESLHDIGETHSTHGVRAYLSRDNVALIMESVPSLRKIVTETRVWTADKSSGWENDPMGCKISLEKRKSTMPHYWFTPTIQVA